MLPFILIGINLILLSVFVFNLSSPTIKLIFSLYIYILYAVVMFSLICCNLFWFYFSFELLLLPIYLLVLYHGYTSDSKQSAFLFIYFALTSSLFWLITVVILYISGWYLYLSPVHMVIFYLFPILVKIPVIPLHLWLNEIHTGSPLSGSVLLAGIILKIAVYAMLEHLIPNFNLLKLSFFLLIIAISSVILAGYSTVRQSDFKRLIAYSSVNHMNVILFALISGDILAISGSILFCIGHAFISSILFIQANKLAETLNTRNILQFKGLLYIIPFFSFFMLLMILFNSGFPPSINWVAELLILGFNFIITRNSVFVIGITIIISIYYSIWSFTRINLGSNNFGFFSSINKIELLFYFIISTLAILFIIVFIC